MIQYLIRNTVPAIIKGTESVLWGQGHHHQIITGSGHEEENHHGTDGCRLAHGCTLKEEFLHLLQAHASAGQLSCNVLSDVGHRCDPPVQQML